MNNFNYKCFQEKKNYAIEASAGTGKTFNIEKIMIKMVYDFEVPLDQILVVTYTEKAAGELKNRIRERFNEKDSELRKHGKFSTKGRDVEFAHIGTIHSFCKDTINEFALVANLPMDLSITGDNDLADFIERYLREGDILKDIAYFIEHDSEFKVNDLKKQLLAGVSKYYLDNNGKEDDKIISKNTSGAAEIKTNLVNYINEHPGCSMKEVCQKFELIKKNYEILKKSSIAEAKILAEYLEKLVSEFFEYSDFTRNNVPDNTIEKEAYNFFSQIKAKSKSPDEGLQNLKKNLKKFVKNNPSCTMNDICENFNAVKKHYDYLKNSTMIGANCFAKWLELFARDSFDYCSLEKAFSDTESEKEAFEFFKSFKDCSYLAGSKQISMKYLDDCYIKWQKEKAKKKQQSFDDMIRSIREAVMAPDSKLKEKLKNKYTYAIIDEFQDTNQKQFDIFKSIFMEDENHYIIVVGDPKQSIYGFQGSNLSVYLKAVAEIEGKGEKCVLSKNHRSTADMVTACNHIFKIYEDDSFQFTDSEFKQLTNKDDKNIPTVTFKDEITKPIWIAMKNNEDESDKCITSREFAKIAVQQIVKCCEKNPQTGKTNLQLHNWNRDDKTEGEYVDRCESRNVNFRDFAILVKQRSEINELKYELRQAGIPYSQYKDISLYKGKENAHWIALLEAIVSPDFTGKNRSLLKKALFTNFFGLGLSELPDKKYERDDLPEIQMINSWKILANEERWEDLIDDILLKSTISQKMSGLKDLQSYSIYRQIGDFCIDYLTLGHSINDLIRRLKGFSAGETSVDDSSGNRVNKGTDFNCVQIMTIHASKGLEFPVIIAQAGFRKEPNDDIHVFMNKDGKLKISFSNEGNKNEKDNEWKRLFYVAYTRAKYILMLPFYSRSKKNKAEKETDQGKRTKYKKDFLYDTLDEFVKNHPSDYKIINDDGTSLNLLNQKVQSILNSGVSVNSSSIANQKIAIQNLEKKLPDIASYMHSYSSLSHSQEKKNVTLPTTSTGVTTVDQITGGLSAFDKNGLQIDGIYDDSEYDDYLKEFPKGALVGTAMHEIFEKIDYTRFISGFEADPDKVDLLKKVIEDSFKKQGYNDEKMKSKVKDWIDLLVKMVGNTLNAKMPIICGSKSNNQYFQLSCIDNNHKKAEAEFLFNKENERLKNYFNGFIDLLFEYNGRFVIVDWKSDSLKDDFTSYTNAQQLKNRVDDNYSIQRTLYAYCLIKWLKQWKNTKDEQEIFEKYFGGVYYVFLRGTAKDTSNGIYCHTWESWKALKESYDEIIKDRIG